MGEIKVVSGIDVLTNNQVSEKLFQLSLARIFCGDCDL